MKVIDKVGKAIITQWVDGSEFGWPPDCTGFLYQPERPNLKSDVDDCHEGMNTLVHRDKDK